VDSLVKYKAIHAVPGLMAAIPDNDTITSTIRSNDETWTQASSDAAIYAVLRLTGQNPADYDMTAVLYNNTRLQRLGFADNDARAAAAAKLKTWWAEHKDKPPYTPAAEDSEEENHE